MECHCEKLEASSNEEFQWPGDGEGKGEIKWMELEATLIIEATGREG